MVRSGTSDTCNNSAEHSNHLHEHQTHRVHFSPVVSQLRYNQQQQHYPVVSMSQAQPQRQLQPPEQNPGFYHNNHDNPNYSAPYYYSQVDNNQWYQYQNHYHHPDALSQTRNKDHANSPSRQIEKVKIQQIHKPNEERVQRVLVTVPSANGCERLTMTMGLNNDKQDYTNLENIKASGANNNKDQFHQTKVNPNSSDGMKGQSSKDNEKILQYPDLLLISTPTTLHEGKHLEVKAGDRKRNISGDSETHSGESDTRNEMLSQPASEAFATTKENKESSRENLNCKSAANLSKRDDVETKKKDGIEKELFDPVSAENKNKISKKKSNSGFVHRLSLIKKFVVGEGNRKMQKKEKNSCGESVGGGDNGECQSSDSNKVNKKRKGRKNQRRNSNTSTASLNASDKSLVGATGSLCEDDEGGKSVKSSALVRSSLLGVGGNGKGTVFDGDLKNTRNSYRMSEQLSPRGIDAHHHHEEVETLTGGGEDIIRGIERDSRSAGGSHQVFFDDNYGTDPTDPNEEKDSVSVTVGNTYVPRNYPNTSVVPTNDQNDGFWREEQAVLALPNPSPRLKKFLFRNRHRRCGEAIDDSTDELSANVEKILEEIAGLESIMDKSSSSKNTSEAHVKEKVDADIEISDICAGLSEMSEESLDFVESKTSVEALVKKPPVPPSSRYSGLRHQFFRNSAIEDPLTRPPALPMKSRHRLMGELDIKLSEFREELHRSREEIARYYPNYDKIENLVRSSMAIDRFGRNPQNSRSCTSWNSSSSTYFSEEIPSATQHSKYAGKELLKEWNRILSEAKEKLGGPSKCFNNERQPSPREFKGILETDLDTGTSREFFVENDTISNSNASYKYPAKVVKSPNKSENSAVKLVQRSSCSMQNLTSEAPQMSTLTPCDPCSKEDRSRSMEFLQDDAKNVHLLPPENTLKKNQESRQASEHELRIQRSLQRLNVPDWYKNYATPGSSPAKPTPAREFGSGTGLAGGWSGLSSSKTSSLTSLQSAGRYSGSRTQFSSRHKSTGTASTGGRSSRESLMSPSSTASASPSPYYERSSFTYGMPYALTRFATARMSCGASPASLSPSPSPVGGITSSTSTPVSSGPMSRYAYNKTPYLGWRSQERLASKTLYRSPAERLAADLYAQKQKTVPPPPADSEKQVSSSEISLVTSPRKENASDLSLNTSDESNSNKLNRVRSSIKEVSNAIVDYVNETKPLDDGINGRASPRRGLVWLESSFVGTKPIDSPGTPDTPSVIMSSSRYLGSQSSAYQHSKRSSLKLDGEKNGDKSRETSATRSRNSETSQAFSSYLSRNEKMGERSNSSSVSSPTLEDILDSLLALRRPHKKIRSREKGHKDKEVEEPSVEAEPSTTATTAPIPIAASWSHQYETPVSDWQERMNQPLDDSAYFPADTDNFMLTSTMTAAGSNNNQDNRENISYSSAFDEDNSNFANINPPPITTSMSQSTTQQSYESSTALEKDESATDVVKGKSMPGATRNRFFCGLSDDDHNDGGSGGDRGCDDHAADTTDSTYFNYHDDDDDVQGQIAQEETAFGTPTEILSHTTIPSIVNNPLAGLNESSNPPTPRHRRVSFDLDISDKDEKSSSRSRRDESIGGSIQCKNTKCAKSATGLEARREFKTCHNCNAYYCSRDCRRTHWEKHKKVCMQSRVGQLCKQIISHVKEDSYVVSQLSTVAKRGFLAKGRGCVKLFFSSPDRAERFLTGGLPELPEPWYIPHSDMLPEEMGAQTFAELSEYCRSYNAETRFILYASVCVVNEVPTSGAVKWEREMISRSSKIRLLLPRTFEENQPHHHAANPAHLNPDDPLTLPDPVLTEDNSSSAPSSDNETLILRSVPTPVSQKLNSSDDRRRREVSFTNIQKHLIERGVDLRRTYPDIYSKLCNYVENDEPFLPVTIYPRNSHTGHQFMCVIMPESSDTSYGTSDAINKVETINISEQS